MSPLNTRMQIESDILTYLGQRHTEETQAAHLLGMLMDRYPLLSVSVLAVDKNRSPVVFAQRGLSGSFVKDLYAKGTLPVIGVALSGEALLPGGDLRLLEPAWRFEHDSKSLYAAPCRIQGETLGVFIAEFREPSLADPATRDAFRAYAQLSAMFLALRGFQQGITRVPEIDPLTGLNTFKFFHEAFHNEISRVKRSDKPVSIMFLKIRYLREMNDVYGHVVTDQALVELARMVKLQLRAVDSISRSGSSLFVVMPETTKEKALAVASRILDAMNATPSGDKDVVLKTAIGVATYPSDGITERALIAQAEEMVHESVRKGGNAVTVFRD